VTDDTRRLNEGRFTETAARYAASRAASYLTQNEALLRLAAPRRRDRALDVACGPGALLATLAPRVRLAVGLDLTTAMLHQARGRFPSGSARLIRGAAERLPFADHSFSLVTCTSAVHHFGEATRVVEEMVRVCASGGRLVIADLVGADDDAVRARQNAIERLRDPAHVELRSPNGLRALLLAAGTVPAGMAEGREARQLGEWCHIANTPPATVQRVRELLLATQPGDLAGMSPAVVGDEVHFSHRWAIVLAERH
jgi:ubiquinone/menaquinone biosynthesis C-methylase UbiE